MRANPRQLLLLAAVAMLAIGGRARRGTRPPSTPRGRAMTPAELRQLANSVGFTAGAVDVAVAVALAESAGYPGAVGDAGASIGLWQVHTPSHPEYSPAQLKDPSYNAHAAYVISRAGTDWTPWSTYKNGAYLAYLHTAGNA